MARGRDSFRVLLLGLTLLALLSPAIQRAAARGTGATPPRHLTVVFLPGICGLPGSDVHCSATINAAQRATATFVHVRAALNAKHVHYASLFYSYRPNSPTSYSRADTRARVERSVSALEGQMRAAAKADPATHFVLLAYSLGGVVAANWAVTHGRGSTGAPGLLNRVSAIITMDSPLRGIRAGILNDEIGPALIGNAWYSLQPSSSVIRQILAFGDPWWRHTAHLHTVANTQDLIVPPSEALLGATHTVTDAGCPRDIYLLRTCHGEVLVDNTLSTYIVCHWIASSACAATPTPTIAPTASPTPTSTSSATTTPTATEPPPPTPTPTASPTLPPPPVRVNRTGR